MKNKICIIALIATLVFCLIVFAFIVKTSDDGVVFINDVNQYNSCEYPVNTALLPKDIPQNAEVVRFVYFDYWHEAGDQYLELKFETSEEMELYLVEVKRAMRQSAENFSKFKIFETYNENNKTFEEIFDASYVTWQCDDLYTGYEIRKDESGKMIYDCNFGVLSYSFEELTVIHTYVCGNFRDHHNYIPEYFKRFDLLNEEHKRLFYID